MEVEEFIAVRLEYLGVAVGLHTPLYLHLMLFKCFVKQFS